MITREKIKREVDILKDDYLEILYRIIKALEMPLGKAAQETPATDKQSEWHDLIRETYGCLSDAPIKRQDLKDLQILNGNAEYFNSEAEDVLIYQQPMKRGGLGSNR